MIGNIGHIAIIESLGAERKTGREIYDDCIRRNIDRTKSSITHRFYIVPNKKALVDLLKSYQEQAKNITNGLLIHLEMHGSDNLDGLILADKSIILWKELIDLFRPINLITCNEVYVSLATCNGREMFQVVEYKEKSPFNCYISASQQVNPDQIVESFFDLFQQVIETGNLINAYKATENEDTKFFYKDSIEIFKFTYERTHGQLKQYYFDRAEEFQDRFRYSPFSMAEMVDIVIQDHYDLHFKKFAINPAECDK